MRLAWPSKSRASEERDEGVSGFLRGEPQPDFLCIGAQKGGTSWLYQQLTSHPEFWMPPVKELHYFNELSRIKKTDPPRCKDGRDRWFLKEMAALSAQPHIDLDGYALLFEAKGKLICGDITPAYSMLNDEIIQEITDYFPALKVIFLARDPVKRAWSQLSMGVRLGMIKPFDADNPDEVIRNVLKPGVLLRSYPSKIVGRWRRYVRPDQFRIYFFDDLEDNPTELRGTILKFLGADSVQQNGRLTANYNSDAKEKKLRLNDNVRIRLGQFFEKELIACAEQLGGRAREWPARYGLPLLWFMFDLADDLDLIGWCDWIA